VQRTTSEIKMETRTVNPLDDALSRLSGPEADRLLARMEEDLRKLVSQQVSEQEREQPLLIEAEVREL
jgi:phosphoribosylamine-glycine ligase